MSENRAVCPSCGNAQEEGGDFCGKCGAPIAAAVSDATMAMIQCPRCGSLVPSDRPLCSRCSGPLHVTSVLQVPTTPPPAVEAGVTVRPTNALLAAGLLGGLPVVVLSLVAGLATSSSLFPPAVFLIGVVLWAVVGPLVGLRMGWHSPPEYDDGFIAGLWISVAVYVGFAFIALATVRELSQGPYAMLASYGIYAGAGMVAVGGGVIGLLAVSTFRALRGQGGTAYADVAETSAQKVRAAGAIGALTTVLCVIVAVGRMVVGGPPPAGQVVQMGEAAKVGSVEWTVTGLRLIKGGLGPDILLVALTGKNRGDKMVLLSHANFGLRDAKGVEYKPEPGAELVAQTKGGETAFSARGIAGGSEVQIWGPFAAPADANGLRLLIKGSSLRQDAQAEVILGQPTVDQSPGAPITFGEGQLQENLGEPLE